MKTTIFVRILLATLLPVFLVILIVIATARNVIYQDGIAYARESAELTAGHISEQTAVKLGNIAAMQEDVGKEMAGIGFSQPDAKQAADRLLDTLIKSSRDLYSVWFAFEPGVFAGEDGRYYRTLLRDNGEIREVFDMSDRQLGDPDASPWYNIPLATGQVYTNILDYYDFTVGEGPIHSFTMTHPIIWDGQTIGCVGLDIRYEDLFPMNSFIDEKTQRNMLVSPDGTILFSPDEINIGNTLWDYNFERVGEIAQAMREKTLWQGEIDSPFTGAHMFLCLYPVEIAYTGQTIYLYRSMPTDGLYGSFNSSMQIIVITGTLGMVLLALCVSFTSRGIAKHVRRITDSFNRVADNNAEDTLGGEHIPIYMTNVVELETLQNALVKMMMQLRKAHGLKLKAVAAEVEKEKLIAASQAKTDFFAAMSHEIRTPMNAVLGISEIMLYEGGLTPTQEKHIQDIKVSADSLLNIINDILDISKIETGRMELRPEHYNFRALMDNIISLASHLAADANLNFVYEATGEFPLCLYGDGSRLRQVLLNLIGNAVKFTKEGSVTLRASMQPETIRFDVVDTGIGIEDEAIGAIFDTFKRLDTRRNREVKGTGLGLSISKSLVELMDGTISVKSVYGKGSTFSVTVPLILGNEKKLRDVKVGRGTKYSDSLRVLVVDDDATNLNVSSGLLRAAHGIRCDTAASGYEAIEKVRETDYDIIFMDHMMPELDGVDTTQLIRQMGGKYFNIPIIALTANAMLGTRQELIDGGMNDFLAKPIQSGRLQEVLDAWVPKDKRLRDLPNDEKSAAAITGGAKGLDTLSDPRLRSLLERAGVNTLAGLENIGFDEDMYIKSLTLFKDRLPHTIRLLDDLTDRQILDELRICTHGLKGSLANIGAAALSGDAHMLEAAAREKHIDDCRALLPPFVKKLEAFHETLREAFSDVNAPAEIIPFDREQFNVNLQRLCAALESHDYETVTDALNAVLSMEYDPEKGKAVSRLKLLIDSFDYPGAAALIRDILSEQKNLETTEEKHAWN